ncbi:serine/threonine-protein kinase [Pseudarthrobacter sp. YS3]|uniref:serine/threonine-protein kinase n=1 Tax=Pseudarthrobacter sp. YS3 TaxID=3453718 RepID=UPI003EEE0DAD
MTNFAVPEVPGFVVGRVLGRGGSSTVWLVTEEKTGRDFALKCLGSEGGSAAGPTAAPRPGPASEEAIRREIRILSVLDHQHLIKAHEAFRFDWPGGSGKARCGVGLLLDYAPGGSLAELVGSRAKLSIGETVTVLTPMAQVLGYLHGKGFTHGDVSPGNVLFTGQGKPMLSDVGIARMVGDVSSVPDHGTPGFMDPSPVDAVRAGLQPERDVYSLAALGWYCLTGEAPRRTADRPPLPLLLPDVPADLAAALEAGLNEDRRLRPTALELATAVYRSAAPLPVDLASSVHSTVIPQLLTRRRIPDGRGSAYKNGLRAWGRRISTSRWPGLVGARPMLLFPEGGRVHPPGPRTSGTSVRAGKVQAAGLEKSASHGKHAMEDGSKRKAAGPPSRDRVGLVPATTARTPQMRGTVLLAAGAGVLVAAGIWLAAAFGPGGPWTAQAGTGEPAASAGATNGAGAAAGNGAGGSNSAPADSLIPAEVSARLDSADPIEAVRGLAAVRSLAFSSGRLELLDLVNVPGSAASAADTRIKDELQESGNVLAGFTSTVSGLDVQPGSSSGRAVIQVISTTSSYEEKNRSGAVVATAPAGAGQQLRLVLVSAEGRWRITDVLPGT